MIGDVLKRTRIIYGYKASEMSSELGISASYLSEIENNKKQPSNFRHILNPFINSFQNQATCLIE